jgi:hypothetical protein
MISQKGRSINRTWVQQFAHMAACPPDKLSQLTQRGGTRKLIQALAEYESLAPINFVILG